MILRPLLFAIALVALVCCQTNPNPSEAELWATTRLNYGDQSSAGSLDKDLTAMAITKPEAAALFQMVYGVESSSPLMPTVAAVTFGNTRAIALTHPGQFIGTGVTSEFWDSVIDWVTYGNIDANIVVGFESHRTYLQSRGATNVLVVDFDEPTVVYAPEGTDVIVIDYSSYNQWSNSLMDRLYQTTEEFVGRSSAHGIIVGGQSRYYKWTDYTSCSLFPANRVFEDHGIVYLCDWWSNRGFDLLVPGGSFRELSLYHTIEYIDTVTQARPLDSSDLSQIMSTNTLVMSLRGAMNGCYCALDDVNAPVGPTRALIPPLLQIISSNNCRAEIPIRTNEAKICAEIEYYGSLYASTPSDVPVAMSSAGFPLMNQVFSASDLTSVSVSIDSDRCQDLSTGLFVLPGQVVSVTIPQSWVGFVTATIGFWKGDTHKFSTWQRNPNSLSFSYELPTATTEIASGFGGNLYINIPCGVFESEFNSRLTGQLDVTNVLRSVWFRGGITDEAAWSAQLSSGHIAPWMELETENLVFTVPRSVVEGLSFEHVQEVADYWDLVCDLYSSFRDKQPDEFKERGVVDAAVAYGYMYASYPMVGPLQEGPAVFDLTQFYSSGTWGWLHEIGHRYERGNSFGPEAGALWNMFGGNVEVFTNVFTCQAIDNTVAENARCSSGIEGVQASLAGNNWNSGMGAFDLLDFYINIKNVFGWDSLSRTLTRGRTYRFPLTDIEKSTRLWLLYSEEVGRNLLPMFNAWGIGVDDTLLYEQCLLVDQVSLGLRFSNPMTDIGEGTASASFNVGAALLGQAAPDRLFANSESVEFGSTNNGDISGPMPENNGSEMTVSIWVYLASRSDGASLIEALDGSLASLWAVKVSSDGLSRLEFSWPQGTAVSVQQLPVASWVHVAVTSDGSEGVMYINGEVDSIFATSAFGSASGNRMVFNYGGVLDGNLAELAYFQSVLPGDRLFAQWSPSPYGFAPFLAADFMPDSPPSCPAHVIPQGIVACNDYAGILSQPNSECDACMSHICDGAAAPVGVDCSNVCQEGFIINPIGSCDSCHPSCADCTAPDDANSCSRCSADTGFPYSEGTSCVAECSDGFTLVADACEECFATCTTCEGTGEGDCLSCTGLLLEDGFCVASCTIPNVEYEGVCESTCPSGFYAESQACEECAPSCEECYGPLATNCLSCTASLPILGNDDSCLSSCPAGQYEDNFTCALCSPECATCESGDACTTCDSGGLTPWFFEFECLETCPPYTTEDSVTFTCNGCDIYGSEPFDNQGLCVAACPMFSFQYQCVSQCPLGHFSDGGDCQPCDSTCETCTTTASTCSSCSAAEYLYENQCVSSCPSGTYAAVDSCEECHSTCETCNAGTSTDCISCSASLPYFLSGQCLEECPGSYYSNGFQCTLCDDSCLTCDGAGPEQCTACDVTKFLLEGECLASCPSGMYATVENNVPICDTCHSSCMTCDVTATSCTSCDPDSNFPILEGRLCVEECIGFDLDGDCVLSCPAGFFEDGSECQVCDVACQSCEGTAANCLVCSQSGPRPLYDGITSQCLSSCSEVGRYAYEGFCLSSCPFGHVADDVTSRCLPCEAPCGECFGTPSTCTACDPLGDFPLLFSGDCVASCPIGFYDALSDCLPCDSTCETCHASGPNSCTGCRFGFVLDPSSACVEEDIEECPATVSDVQSVSSVAIWPEDHTTVSQEVLCLPGTSMQDHCIPFGSRIETSIDVTVSFTASLFCALCDNDELVSSSSRTLRQDVVVQVETGRSLRFLNSLISDDVRNSQLEELFQAAAIDNTLNIQVLKVAEGQFYSTLSTIGLSALCQESESAIELPQESIDSNESIELPAVGTLSNNVCPFPDTPAWNQVDAYEARCICDGSVDGVENPCAALKFAPFQQNLDAICHPVACSSPTTDEEQWVEIKVELDVDFYSFSDFDTKEILSELVNSFQLNTVVSLGDVYLTRMDIGSVVMTLMIDSTADFEDDYSAAVVIVDALNDGGIALSAPVIEAVVVTPNRPPYSNSYSTVVTSYSTIDTDSYSTIDTQSYTNTDTNSLTNTGISFPRTFASLSSSTTSSSSSGDEISADGGALSSNSNTSAAVRTVGSSILFIACVAFMF